MSFHTTPTPEGRRWLRRRGRWWAWLAVAGVTAVAVAVPVAWASHHFADVPNAQPRHDAISNIAGAGITVGCLTTLYCPANPVRRDEMASFLQRGLGRAALSTTVLDGDIAPSDNPVTDTLVASVSIAIGGAASHTQFVKVEATMHNLYNGGTPNAPYTPTT